MKIPVVDLAACTLCMGCVEVCPEVFQLNEDLGMIEVLDLERYPRDTVDEAIKFCPVDAIEWEE
ncbi:MAG: ferredoxin [Desulfobacteraceae bacterium]